MRCKDCGANIDDNSRVCAFCGSQQMPQAQYQGQQFNQGQQFQGQQFNQGQPFPGQQFNQGQPFPGQPMMSRPDIKTWMVPSIIATILCCIPFGIIAIMNASKVQPALDCGDYQTAEIYSGKAKTWFIVTLISGLIIQPIAFFIQFAAALAEM